MDDHQQPQTYLAHFAEYADLVAFGDDPSPLCAGDAAMVRYQLETLEVAAHALVDVHNAITTLRQAGVGGLADDDDTMQRLFRIELDLRETLASRAEYARRMIANDLEEETA